MLSATALVFAVNTVTSILKNYVIPKVGKTGTQFILFVVSMIGALYVTYQDYFPTVKNFVLATLTIFSLAVALYEVLLSRLPVFKKGKK